MSEPVSGFPGPGRLTLGHLIALNDEIAALSRAGLPLERGLRDAGRDYSGRLSQTMSRLSQRMDRGATLPEALAAEGDAFPPIYRAVVEAGIRAGRLPAALETLASFARSCSEARRAIGLALAYPLIVLVLAYTLFLGLVLQLVPRFEATFHALQLPVPAPLHLLSRASETVVYWGPVLPALLVAFVLAWAGTSRASVLGSGSVRPLFAWFPWVRPMLARLEAANFAQVLAILVEQGVAYPEAILLASESSGDPRLARAGKVLAEAVRRGEPAIDRGYGAKAVPPLLRWLLSSGRPQAALVGALRQFATQYRKRALHEAEKIRVFLPTILLLAIGMTATLLYGLTLFVPLTLLLRELAVP